MSGEARIGILASVGGVIVLTCVGGLVWTLAFAPHPSDGATLARICRDGTHIWHWRDGTYRTGMNNIIDDIETVCA